MNENKCFRLPIAACIVSADLTDVATMPQLIIFDCDGVLVDSELLSRRGMADVFQQAGIPATAQTIAPYTGMKQPDIIAGVCAEFGHAVPPDLDARFWPAIRALFHAELAPVPGIAELLARLPDRRCVASSSHPERIRESLDLTGLARFFGDDIFSSHQVPRGKPAPDLFLFAADNMGAAPSQCVVFEDSVAGVRAARAAGMRVIAVAAAGHADAAHRDALRAEQPDAIIDDYRDADAIMERMTGAERALQ